MPFYYTFLLSLTVLMNSVCAAEAPLVDPTMPSGYKSTAEEIVMEVEVETPRWILSSTLLDPYQKVAIINGQQLFIGEIIDDAELIEITHHHVKLRYQGEFIVLNLKHPSFISHVKAK